MRGSGQIVEQIDRKTQGRSQKFLMDIEISYGYRFVDLFFEHRGWGQPHRCLSMPIPILAKFRLKLGSMGKKSSKISVIVAIFIHLNIVINEN